MSKYRKVKRVQRVDGFLEVVVVTESIIYIKEVGDDVGDFLGATCGVELTEENWKRIKRNIRKFIARENR